ncbi:glycosyltransferase [Agrobacterium tumefaciens]|uniref:glycosyltransferase n=1 Tax=Agrobacterium tumefaciens TaxID=358 RepID=UPI000DCF8243|nr:glycosyltransferase involved in cell wall biosynthesis [Rhizobium nepotum]NSZ09440.1 glycosyltransferase [Agrobacterium tumefaciens]NTC81099.1 glycosyltransferase [Agrobacterium tumefaciens]NTD09572.1 glycosyltransferase [Agrobacterium tumefaciens]
MKLADQGEIDLVKKSGLFDEAWYLKQYPDVAMLNMDPVEHFLWLGARLGRDPSCKFCTQSYSSHHSDVAKAKVNPLLHYVRHGKAEGRIVVPSRHYDSPLKKIQAEAEVEQPWLVSVIMPAFNRESTISASIRSVLDQTYRRFQLLVIDDGSTDKTIEIVETFLTDDRVRLIRAAHGGVSAARNKGLENSSGELIAYLDSDNVWTANYLATMVGYMSSKGADVAYSQIEILNDSDRQIRGELYNRERMLKGNFIDLNVYCHLRSIYEEQGGFDESLRRMVDWDLIIRQTGVARNIAHVPFVGCKYTNTSADANRISLKEFKAFGKVVVAKATKKGDCPLEDAIKLNFAIKIPAPFDKRQEWGDFHYADSLAGALNRLGHKVRIDFHGEWDRKNTPQDDVVIVIRGLDEFKPVPGVINILWNISHPDQLELAEYEAYDLAYVASLSYANFLSAIGVKKIKPLLQATDIHRFNPNRKKPANPSEVLFVGNSRNIYRDMVKWSVEAELNVTVFGTRWEQYIPKRAIGGANISNKELGGYYNSAAFVLNDHWASMKEFGLLSNRLFDVLSAGGRVISDSMPAISYVFGNSVVQVDSKEELQNAVRTVSDHDTAAVSAEVRMLHSFEARAKTILDDIFGLLGVRSTLPAAPFVLRKKRLLVNGIVRQDREFPQSSAFIRLLCPLTTDEAYGEIDFKLVPAKLALESRTADVTIVQRTAFDTLGDAQALVAGSSGHRQNLIVDNDDAFCFMDEAHREYELYKPRIEALNFLLDHSKENWVSTDVLREAYSHLSTQPVVMQNAIDPRLWRDYRRPNRGRNAVPQLVYAGTATHDADFNLIIEALDRVAQKQRFELTVIGAVRQPPKREWLRVLTPPRSSQSYPAFVRWFRQQGPFDVGLAPLIDTKFNSAKSDLKLLDYGALDILPVASNGPSYSETLRATQGGILVTNTTENWTDAISDVVGNIQNYDQMRGVAFDYAYEKRNASKAYRTMRESIFSVKS